MTSTQTDATAAGRRTYRRIVAKFGTNILTAGSDRLDLEMMASLVGQVARLRHDGVEVVIVTSGGVAAGRERLRSPRRRRDLPYRQVLAAVGQVELMQKYHQLFDWHELVVGQALLTRRDLVDRDGYLNARNTLNALLEFGTVPIVNENDTVAVDQIAEMRIGDNDNLSAFVANLIEADLLAILTNIGGLYTADPHLDPTATLIPRVDRVDAEVEALAGGAISARAIGGMATKLQAARLATASGVDVVIAGAHEPQVLSRLAGGESIGTYFPASTDRLESRKRWMLAGLAARGHVTVDAGAVHALRDLGRSLLPAGITAVAGPFERGDTVTIVNAEGSRVAFGITNYDHHDVERIRGQRSENIAGILGHTFGAEVIHRNNLVLI
ncbi:MAG: glutamate 5-kinase [Dehalococcoidia bacterium]